MTVQKIVVDKLKLIEAIKARKAEVVAAHAAAAKGEAAAIKAWQKAAHAAVDAYKPGWDGNYRKRTDVPDAPGLSRTPDTTNYDRSISLLEMSPAETIVITGEDFARYVR